MPSINAWLMMLAEYAPSTPLMPSESVVRRETLIEREPPSRVSPPSEHRNGKRNGKRNRTAHAARECHGYLRRLTLVTDATRRVVTRQQSKVERDQTVELFPGNIDVTAERLADALLSKIIEWKLARLGFSTG
jgi:hypothetical protein